MLLSFFAEVFCGVMAELSFRQLRFVEEFVKCGVGTQAAKLAGYSCPKTAAMRLKKNPKIKSKLDELRQNAMQQAQLSLDKLIEELEEARQVALDKEMASAAVSASMGKAKLLGLDKPQKEHEDEKETDVPQILVKFVD